MKQEIYFKSKRSSILIDRKGGIKEKDQKLLVFEEKVNLNKKNDEPKSLKIEIILQQNQVDVVPSIKVPIIYTKETSIRNFNLAKGKLSRHASSASTSTKTASSTSLASSLSVMCESNLSNFSSAVKCRNGLSPIVEDNDEGNPPEHYLVKHAVEVNDNFNQAPATVTMRHVSKNPDFEVSDKL